jgi:hypothetical protein
MVMDILLNGMCLLYSFTFMGDASCKSTLRP